MSHNFEEFFGLTLIEKNDDFERFECSASDFENICFNIQSHYAYTWLVDIVAQDIIKNQNRFELSYMFLNVENYKWYSISIKVSEGVKVKSIAHMWRNASSYEQEINELFGVPFSREYGDHYRISGNLKPMRKDFSQKKALKFKAFDDSEFNFKITPENSLRRNQEELNLKLENNLIQKCVVKPGQYHIGLEKILEGTNLSESYHLLESYYPLKSIYWGHLLSTCIEAKQGLEITNRAKAIRMVLLELNRVANHLQFLSEVFYEFRMETMYTNSLLWIKRIQSLIISYTGNEFGVGVVRYGGVTKDVSQVWLSRTINEIVWMENALLHSYKNIIQNNYVKSTFDFRLVSKRVASSWSLTGPIVRAVGINLDFRKLKPFYFYDDVSFEVPIGVKGTAYDLLLVKFEEMFQSFKIMVQVLDNLPTGQIMHESVNLHMYYKDGSKELNEEAYINSVKGYLKVNDFKNTSFVEGSNGIMSLSADFSENKFDRLKLNTSSFALKTLYEKVLKGNELNKAKPFWSMMDISLKEVER
jgi:NADH:ubiquinone oxidoreductase subunit D